MNTAERGYKGGMRRREHGREEGKARHNKRGKEGLTMMSEWQKRSELKKVIKKMS